MKPTRRRAPGLGQESRAEPEYSDRGLLLKLVELIVGKAKAEEFERDVLPKLTLRQNRKLTKEQFEFELALLEQGIPDYLAWLDRNFHVVVVAQ